MVFPQVDELEDVGMPGLEVDSKGSWTLVATLVNISGSRVIGAEHRDDTIRVSISTCDVRSSGANVVNVDANSTGSLGDHGTVLEGVVDALDRVVFHTNEEARGELRIRCPSVE